MRDERISGAKNEIYNHTPYGGYVESIKQKRVVSLCQKWYFVTKIVLTFCEKKNCSSDREKLLKFEAEGQEFANILRSLEQFVQTVKGRSEQFLVTECFFNLFLEVSQF